MDHQNGKRIGKGCPRGCSLKFVGEENWVPRRDAERSPVQLGQPPRDPEEGVPPART